MRPLVAYAVQEDAENTGGIVFARSNAEARRRGSSEFGDGGFNWGRARRAKWADEFAPGPVPFRAMFDHGWWQECSGCGCVIREDAENDDGEPIAFDFLEIGSAIYCRPACRERWLAAKAEEKRIADYVIADLSARLLRVMPGAVIGGRSHCYVPSGPLPRAPQQGYIEFAFPGARYGLASYRFDKYGERPHVNVCYGDTAAFYAWRAAGYPPHLMDAGEAA